MKKLLASLIMLFLIASNLNPTFAESIEIPSTSQISIENMKDINKSSWAFKAVQFAVSKGYMEVFEDNTFRPNQVITRGEAAAIIAKTMEVSLESDFELQVMDVSESHPYYKEIRKLTELGIVDPSNYFYPDEPIIRSQIAKMIALAFHVEVDQNNKKSYKDIPDNYWAKNYIESLSDVNMMNGTSRTTFSPKRYVSRAEIAMLIMRGKDFENKVENLQIAYDYLAKDYISTENSHTSYVNEVVKLVNEEREKKGLNPLKVDVKLNQLAVIKAQDMINRHYFDHQSPFYGNPWDMATLFDYSYTSFGENIARNFTSPKEVISAWMASLGHKENILRDTYTNIGVGIKVDNEGDYYWVQLFSSE